MDYMLRNGEWYCAEKRANALRAALAEPAIKESLTVAEQNPVGQLQEGAYGRGQVLWFNKPANQSMLYTAPPRREWVSLTDEEISAVDWKSNETLHDFSRAIEAKLREKNEK
jgi:hypothetical protein